MNFIVVRKYHAFHLYFSDSQPYLHKTLPSYVSSLLSKANLSYLFPMTVSVFSFIKSISTGSNLIDSINTELLKEL